MGNLSSLQFNLQKSMKKKLIKVALLNYSANHELNIIYEIRRLPNSMSKGLNDVGRALTQTENHNINRNLKTGQKSVNVVNSGVLSSNQTVAREKPSVQCQEINTFFISFGNKISAEPEHLSQLREKLPIFFRPIATFIIK
ncbi:hypothetical protein CEXT_536361 [Caerostris extrusa]|uniref:Uncharacterized protein n=1 Tax=Caerostris extrusa TaxID=172846 RepID=A0AAV4PK34_CAEEX|nr:hypothetical protein CEXT_536361 [Caerostris extrusa]